VLYRLPIWTGNLTHYNAISLLYRNRSSAQFSGYTEDFQVAWADIPDAPTLARQDLWIKKRC